MPRYARSEFERKLNDREIIGEGSTILATIKCNHKDPHKYAGAMTILSSIRAQVSQGLIRSKTFGDYQKESPQNYNELMGALHKAFIAEAFEI